MSTNINDMTFGELIARQVKNTREYNTVIHDELIDYGEFAVALATQFCRNPGQRYGQQLYTALHIVSSEHAKTIIGTDADPFYADCGRDERVLCFMEYVVRNSK